MENEPYRTVASYVFPLFSYSEMMVTFASWFDKRVFILQFLGNKFITWLYIRIFQLILYGIIWNLKEQKFYGDFISKYHRILKK